MRATRIAFAAIIIAAAACTDSTSPASPDSLAAARTIKDKQALTIASSVPASLYSGYSARSPHWQHITTMMTDFYYGWTTSERAWAGAHYDYAMSGTGSAWRAINPAVGHYPYALLWTTLVFPSSPSIQTGYYADMRSWFRSHPQYSLERAFVHKRGSTGDSASRVFLNRPNSARWVINPADAGAIAYDVNRLQRIVGSENGVFFDESATGDVFNYLPATREFTSSASYYTALTQLLGTIRRGLGGKRIILNLAEYTTDLDYGAAVAAGGAHLEMFNSFENSGMIQRWAWVSRLTSSNVFVDFVSRYSSHDLPAMASSYPRGNSASNVQRAKLWELASYYLAVPATPQLLALQLENRWSKPYSSLWMKAQEANIGHPLATRVQASHGNDPAGNSYIVYNRNFDRALVVLRLQQGWGTQSYGDASAITIALPAGERWLPLNADGTVGAAITSIRLRNSEAAVLLKGSKM